MSIYKLPEVKLPKLKAPRFPKVWKSRAFLVSLIILISFILGGIGGTITGSYFYSEVKDYLLKLKIEIPELKVVEKETVKEYIPQTTQEEAIIKVVKEVSPAVVSIIITKDVPIFEEYYYNPFQEFEEFFGQPFEFQIPQYRQKGTEKQEVGGGTGFVVSEAKTSLQTYAEFKGLNEFFKGWENDKNI